MSEQFLWLRPATYYVYYNIAFVLYVFYIKFVQFYNIYNNGLHLLNTCMYIYIYLGRGKS